MNKIIVSLTSYPKRIEDVDKVVKTLLIQTRRPDRIILWLSETEFLRQNDDMPRQLLSLCEYGLEIRWVSEDLKPHKKYFYAMQEFPDDIIITVDDDMYCGPELIECLYRSYLSHPKAISCTRANLICRDEVGNLLPYKKWGKNYLRCPGVEMMDLLAVGCGGVLYPPKCFNLDILCNVNNIRNLCLYQDDLWLKMNELICNIPVVLIKEQARIAMLPVDGSQHVALCENENISGNDQAIENLNDYLLSTISMNWNQAIFSCDKTVLSWMQKKRENMNRLVHIAEKHGAYIYGAGDGAKSTYKCLQLCKQRVYINGFVVTKQLGNPETLYDFPVVEIGKIQDLQALMIISTATKTQREIAENLKNNGFQNVIAVNNWMIGDYNLFQAKMEDIENEFLASCELLTSEY